MGILLGCIQFILIAMICVQEVKRKSPAVFLWATLMIMFGVMHLLTVFADNSQYTDSTIDEASLFVILFCVFYMITRNIICLSQQKDYPMLSYIIKDDVTITNSSYVSYLVVLFALVAFMMCYKLISFSGGILNASWGSGREYTASLSYANSNQIFNILYFSLSGLPLLLWLKKDRKVSIFCALVILMVTVLTRNRILILPLLVFVLALFVLKITHLSLKHLIFAALAGVSVIYIVYGLRVFRHYGTIETFLQQFNFSDFIGKINEYIATDNGELGLRNDFYYFVQHDNEFHGFGEMATYIRMLLVYVPTRFAFGLKPDDFAITMGSAVGMVAGGSTHPTLFGDCYANAGFIGVFLGAFWAVYCSISDKMVIRCKNPVTKILVYCLFSVTFTIMGRGSVYNPFFFVAWGIPMLWIIIGILKKLPRIRLRLR